MNKTRGRSNVSSSNFLRKSSVHSDVLSMDYTERVQAIVSYTSPLVWKYIPMVESPPNHISLPSMVATFLTTCLMAVLQPSRYSVFHSGDTSIQLSLL